MSRLQGRRALVTGASQGLGAAMARQLAAVGVEVALTARAADRLAEVAATVPAGRIVLVPADLADPDAPPRLVGEATARLGGIDILINNASSVEPLGPFAGATDRALADALALGLTAPLRIACAALRPMTERGWGRVVNISSGAATAPGIPWAAAYSVGKSALEAATVVLAAELAGAAVTVNAVRPGTMATGMQERMRSAGPGELSQRTRERYERLWRDGGLADPDVAAQFVVRLLSTDLNGRILDVRKDLAVLGPRASGVRHG